MIDGSKIKDRNKYLQYQHPSFPRKLIMDKTLSPTSKYIYCYMSCQPVDWKFYLEPMSKDVGICVGTLKKYIKELLDRGWVSKGGQHNENGQFGAVEYTINTTPKKPKNTVVQNLTDGQNLPHGKNCTTNNTNSINTISTHYSSINTPIKDNINNLSHTACAENSDLEKEKDYLLNEVSWKERVCMNFQISLDNLQLAIDNFFAEIDLKGMKVHQNEQDLKSHFISWLKYNKDGVTSKRNAKYNERGITADEFLAAEIDKRRGDNADTDTRGDGKEILDQLFK